MNDRTRSLRPLIGLALLSGSAWSQGPLLGDLHRMIPGRWANTFDAALGDVDGDGDPDLFTADYTDGARFARNEGGVLRHAFTLGPVSSTYRVLSVSLLDVEGDGDLDTILGRDGYDNMATPIGGGNLLYRNNGNGGFTLSAGSLPLDLSQTSDVGGADLDGEGSVDLFVTGSTLIQPPFTFIPGEYVYLNDGSGKFTDAAHPVLLDSSAVSLADVDLDGDVDAFVTRPSSNLAADWLQLNDGAGNFTPTTGAMPAIGNPSTSKFELGDVDEDGWPDAFGGTHLLLGDGAAGFLDATAGLPPSTFARDLALVDVNGDAHLDALIVESSPPNRLFLGDGTGSFTDASAGLPMPTIVSPFQRYNATSVADVDGDGDVDAVVTTNGGANLLWLGDGAGSFLDTTVFAGDALRLGARTVLGDLDGNGTLDAYLASAYQDRLALGNGLGEFTDATANLPPSPLGSTESVALIEADGDGDLDVFTGSNLDDRLYLNDGNAVFSELPGAIPVPTFQNVTSAIAVADVDGDGDQDALTGANQKEWVLANDGSGFFTDESFRLPDTTSDRTQAIAIADLDADGFLDAVFGAERTDRLYLNDGTGFFTEGTLPFTGSTASLAVADVEADGDLDVLFGIEGAERSKLLLNDGDANLTDAGTGRFPASSRNTFAVAFIDLDRDGDPDAVLGNATFGSGTGSDADQIYRNDGTGTFAPVSGPFLENLRAITFSFAVADVDGDGDEDLVKGSAQGLHFNLSRQLAWRAVPGIGKPLELDLYGTQGARWWLLAAPLLGETPLPPLGTLRLDPRTLSILGAGFLDAQGRATSTFPVPDLPSLVGQTLYFQAALGQPILLSNVERVTFTEY